MINPIGRIRASIEYRRQKVKYPNIIESGVSHPELVHQTAIVSNTNLNGPILVSEYASIHGCLLLGNIEIGTYTNINGPGTDIYSGINPVIIGAFCSIARHVSIQEYNHRVDCCSTLPIMHDVFGEKNQQESTSKGFLTIGNDVWIGTHCVILSGSKIEDGAIIGANSVVTSTIPPYAIAVGSPAKVVKYRFSEPIIERLLVLKWWNWPRERILQNRPLFEGELTLEKLDAVKD